jgi:hypothetical protein
VLIIACLSAGDSSDTLVRAMKWAKVAREAGIRAGQAPQQRSFQTIRGNR